VMWAYRVAARTTVMVALLLGPMRDAMVACSSGSSSSLASTADFSRFRTSPKRLVIPKIRLLSEERSKTLFPSNLDRGEGTCFESAVDRLIQRPS
jgi:hypothetical protein